MPDPSTLPLFLAAAVVLLVTPGPAVLYIVARSIEQGRLAGVVSTLGVGLGSLVHVAAAALGLSALLMSSATLFLAVKYLGAAYLVFLGARTLLARPAAAGAASAEPRRLSRVFLEGVVVNLLNPKTALFFFAFLPQFVDPARGAVASQVSFLGVAFVLLGVCSDGLWAVTAGTASEWLRGNVRFLRAQRYVSGGTLIGLGVATAVSGSGRK
jgi:threonine/homoserine/homoserine lactone efflux protein